MTVYVPERISFESLILSTCIVDENINLIESSLESETEVIHWFQTAEIERNKMKFFIFRFFFNFFNRFKCLRFIPAS